MSVGFRLRGGLAAIAILTVPGAAGANPDPAPSWMQACVAKLRRARPSWPARCAPYEERTAFLPAIPELPGGVRYELYEGDQTWLKFEVAPRLDGGLRAPRRPHHAWIEFRAAGGSNGGTLKSVRHDAHIWFTLDPSAPSEGGRAEAKRMESSLKKLAEWCLDRADSFPGFLPPPDLGRHVIHPSCDRACTCTFAGPPLFTETGPGPAAVEFLGPLLSRTYRADSGRLTTTLTRWIDLLAGRSEPVATTPGSHAPWLRDRGDPGPERPWPHRVAGFGHPSFNPAHEARSDRIVITEAWGRRFESTLLMPPGRPLVAWAQDEPKMWLLVALADGDHVSWYLVQRPQISMDEHLDVSCW